MRGVRVFIEGEQKRTRILTIENFWVFGYGSLMWNPGFEVVSQQIAVLHGFHRSFCMRSIHHRGTEQDPGLVLALDAFGEATCHGVAFEVAGHAAGPTMDYLRERELVSAAYLEETLAVKLRDGRHVDAVTYVIDREHWQYCGGLPMEEQAQIIAGAHGGRGANIDYLRNTAQHLVELGIEDAELSSLSRRTEEIAAGGGSARVK